MSRSKAELFTDLHVPGSPLVLYNVWDAGSAKTIAEAGAKAIATGSWSVAAAQGYGDRQEIPMDLVLRIAARIVATVDLPVSLDFEGGYAEAPADVAANVSRVIDAGVIGINFEDQVVGGSGLYSVDAQCERIGAIRQAASAAGVPLFINARTDLFLKQSDRDLHAELLDDASRRANAYQEAGASGFFVPGLIEPSLLEAICQSSPLPVNVMMMDDAPSAGSLASLGIARISYGPGPYINATAALADQFRASVGD